MLSLYVMPVRGAGTDADPVRPKYAAQLGNVNWKLIDYQGTQLCLVGIQDAPPNLDQALRGQADVMPISSDLDIGIGSTRMAAAFGALRQIRGILQQLGQ